MENQQLVIPWHFHIVKSCEVLEIFSSSLSISCSLNGPFPLCSPSLGFFLIILKFCSLKNLIMALCVKTFETNLMRIMLKLTHVLWTKTKFYTTVKMLKNLNFPTNLLLFPPFSSLSPFLSCLCLLSVRIAGVYHHTLLSNLIS